MAADQLQGGLVKVGSRCQFDLSVQVDGAAGSQLDQQFANFFFRSIATQIAQGAADLGGQAGYAQGQSLAQGLFEQLRLARQAGGGGRLDGLHGLTNLSFELSQLNGSFRRGRLPLAQAVLYVLA